MKQELLDSDGGPIRRRTFGGPTYVCLRQDAMVNAWAEYGIQTDPASPASGYRVTLRGVNHVREQLHSSGWGYHTGASVTVLLTRVLGVGATIRFLRADVEVRSSLPGYNSEPHGLRIRACGLQVLGGAHLRF